MIDTAAKAAAAVTASAADPTDSEKRVDVVTTKRAADKAAEEAAAAKEAAEEGCCGATANGVGNLLKFGYWTTDGKDTLVAVTNLGKAQETVNVKIVDGMGMPAGTITVCLGAGDTWTAAIVASEDGMGSTVRREPRFV